MSLHSVHFCTRNLKFPPNTSRILRVLVSQYGTVCLWRVDLPAPFGTQQAPPETSAAFGRTET